MVMKVSVYSSLFNDSDLSGTESEGESNILDMLDGISPS